MPTQVDRQPESQQVTFAQVSAIFVNPVYGPCSSCHSSSNWPFLDSADHDGWKKFEASATSGNHGITTIHELSQLVLDCIDQQSESHCAGDPTTRDDNIDYKMPTKYGYEPASSTDIEVLRQWLKVN